MMIKPARDMFADFLLCENPGEQIDIVKRRSFGHGPAKDGGQIVDHSDWPADIPQRRTAWLPIYPALLVTSSGVSRS